MHRKYLNSSLHLRQCEYFNALNIECVLSYKCSSYMGVLGVADMNYSHH